MSRNGYLERQRELHIIRLSSQTFSRAKTLDGVVITLGQMGQSEDFLHEFMKKYLEVEADITELLAADYKNAKDDGRPKKQNVKLMSELKFADSKNTIDKLILQYIYPDDYLAFDYRYGLKDIPIMEEDYKDEQHTDLTE